MMETATEMLRTRDRAREEHYMKIRIAKFIREFAPSDPYERSRFEGALYYVVHEIHKDAASHYLDLLLNFVRAAALNPQPIIVAKPSTGDNNG